MHRGGQLPSSGVGFGRRWPLEASALGSPKSMLPGASRGRPVRSPASLVTAVPSVDGVRSAKGRSQGTSDSSTLSLGGMAEAAETTEHRESEARVKTTVRMAISNGSTSPHLYHTSLEEQWEFRIRLTDPASSRVVGQVRSLGVVVRGARMPRGEFLEPLRHAMSVAFLCAGRIPLA